MVTIQQLKKERLRADFYEEMVAFGKEVYGIDLKKLAPSSPVGFTLQPVSVRLLEYRSAPTKVLEYALGRTPVRLGCTAMLAQSHQLICSSKASNFNWGSMCSFMFTNPRA